MKHTNVTYSLFAEKYNTVICLWQLGCCWRTRVSNMCTNFIVDIENFVFLCVEILSLTFFRCSYEGVSDFPFLRHTFALSLWETGGGGGRGKEERQRCGPQQQRGVSLMAGGGRKSQDLMFDVKLSNSHMAHFRQNSGRWVR